MLEMGARFTNDLYIKVSFDPEEEDGVIIAIFGRGEDTTVKSGEFNVEEFS